MDIQVEQAAQLVHQLYDSQRQAAQSGEVARVYLLQVRLHDALQHLQHARAVSDDHSRARRGAPLMSVQAIVDAAEHITAEHTWEHLPGGPLVIHPIDHRDLAGEHPLGTKRGGVVSVSAQLLQRAGLGAPVAFTDAAWTSYVHGHRQPVERLHMMLLLIRYSLNENPNQRSLQVAGLGQLPDMWIARNDNGVLLTTAPDV